jgi:asparagine synthase (glutamine-hydrolysing)
LSLLIYDGVMQMCSIAGIIGGTLSSDEKLEIGRKMNESLAHRGPDQHGFYTDQWLCLAHNRLSVIDPENGIQPMTRMDHGLKYTIIYNGELYNTLELRRELEGQGWEFTTNCDTEVLLVSYMAWGKACLDKLNGIFAFAIYDERLHKVFLARDRVGVKPLFYTFSGGALLFASEIKALFMHPDVRPRLDEKGLWQIIFLLPTRIPGTGVFKDIKELLPGYYMESSPEGFKTEAYWKLRAIEHRDSPAETIEKVQFLVRDSITRQLVSDVPLCTLLSGGLDSSAISAISAMELKRQGKELNTYSFEYEGNREHFKPTNFQPNSDDDYAVWMAQQIGSNHTVLNATCEDLTALLTDAVKYRDLPGMGDVDSSLLYYCSLIKKNHTVGLSGECADEIFGGYPWFSNAPEKLDRFPWLYSLDMRLSLFNNAITRPKDGIDFVNGTFQDCFSECPVLEGESAMEHTYRQIGYASIMYFMHSLLERKDRMSMASALEVRVPFADHRIAEYAFNIPYSIKRRDDVAKAVLRDAMGGILPDRIVNRKKSPYPKTHNPRYEQMVTDALIDRLRDKSSILHELLRQDILQDLDKLKSITWFGQLMAKPQLIAYLIQLDYWFKHFEVELV